MDKQTIKDLDKAIKCLYWKKHSRYEKIYAYMGSLYEDEGYIWYLRSIRVAHSVNKAVAGILAVVITVLTFYINTAKEILGVSSKCFSVAAALVLLWMIYYILNNITIKQYVISVMDDIEKDKKDFDVHGKSKHIELVKKAKESDER